jgi:hypothetical protein
MSYRFCTGSISRPPSESRQDDHIGYAQPGLGGKFGDDDPLGRQITIESGDFVGVYTIIGVYQYEDNMTTMLQNVSEKDVSMAIGVFFGYYPAKIGRAHV